MKLRFKPPGAGSRRTLNSRPWASPHRGAIPHGVFSRRRHGVVVASPMAGCCGEVESVGDRAFCGATSGVFPGMQ